MEHPAGGGEEREARHEVRGAVYRVHRPDPVVVASRPLVDLLADDVVLGHRFGEAGPDQHLAGVIDLGELAPRRADSCPLALITYEELFELPPATPAEGACAAGGLCEAIAETGARRRIVPATRPERHSRRGQATASATITATGAVLHPGGPFGAETRRRRLPLPREVRSTRPTSIPEGAR